MIAEYMNFCTISVHIRQKELKFLNTQSSLQCDELIGLWERFSDVVESLPQSFEHFGLKYSIASDPMLAYAKIAFYHMWKEGKFK